MVLADVSMKSYFKYGALAASIQYNEAIDMVCYITYPEHDSIKDNNKLLHHAPSCTTTKSNIAKLKDWHTREIFHACKVAPKLEDMDVNTRELRENVNERINKFAFHGRSVLGVAVNRSGDVPVENGTHKVVEFMPFRYNSHDTASTVKRNRPNLLKKSAVRNFG